MGPGAEISILSLGGRPGAKIWLRPGRENRWSDPMVLTIVAILIAGRLAAQLGLNALNGAAARRHSGAPPPAVAAVMDGPTYARAVAYTRAKLRFDSIAEAWAAAVLAVVIFSGVLPAL